jgi:glycosyltransferase involved in cell wall biosynthesis
MERNKLMGTSTSIIDNEKEVREISIIRDSEKDFFHINNKKFYLKKYVKKNKIIELNHSIGIISEMLTCYCNKKIQMAISLGRVINVIAGKYNKMILCTPIIYNTPKRTQTYSLDMKNIEMRPQPGYANMLASLKHPYAIIRAYAQTLRQADHIFVRGMLPYVGVFYMLARYYKRKPVHWIVGDPISLLRSHRRSNWIKDTMSIIYAYQDRFFTRFGRWLTDGTLVCNGKELAAIYESSRTKHIVSSTVTSDEFFYREDTCTGEFINILYVGYIRPEKGIEFLISALPMLKNKHKWRMTIIGPWEDFKEYKERLAKLISDLGIDDKIDWKGFIPYGPILQEQFRRHDIFVLPSLSEGTPHVITEAKANSLPIIATDVGGIPTSITDGIDGILVTPKDPNAIAQGIDRIVEDRSFRRKLIRNGLETAKGMTVEHFVETISTCLSEGN